VKPENHRIAPAGQRRKRDTTNVGELKIQALTARKSSVSLPEGFGETAPGERRSLGGTQGTETAGDLFCKKNEKRDSERPNREKGKNKTKQSGPEDLEEKRKNEITAPERLRKRGDLIKDCLRRPSY